MNKSREIAEKDGVTIPTTEEDYTIRGKPSASTHHLSLGSSMDIEENSNMVRQKNKAKLPAIKMPIKNIDFSFMTTTV